MEHCGTVAGLFVRFMKLGCFTFGGGLSIVAQMHRLFVEEEERISSEELLDITGVARSLPGAFVGNVAFLYGYREAGIPGGVASLLGMVIPPLLLLAVITHFHSAFKNSRMVTAAMTGIRAAVVPIIAVGALNLTRGAFPHPLCFALAGVAFLLYFVFNVSCVWIVILGAAAGIAIGVCSEKSGGGARGAN